MGKHKRVVLASTAEALQCAFALTGLDYNHVDPEIKDDFLNIYIDTKEKNFFLTNDAGMRVVETILKSQDNQKVNLVTIKDILTWQKKPIRP